MAQLRSDVAVGGTVWYMLALQTVRVRHACAGVMNCWDEQANVVVVVGFVLVVVEVGLVVGKQETLGRSAAN